MNPFEYKHSTVYLNEIKMPNFHHVDFIIGLRKRNYEPILWDDEGKDYTLYNKQDMRLLFGKEYLDSLVRLK